jgi:hypothetical protein
MSLRMTGVVVGALLIVAPPAAGKPVFVEADDAPDPRGLTVYGSGLARVEPPTRPNERTIERAIDAAKPVAEARAVRGARGRAAALAARAGLTLGSIQAVRVSVPDAERFGGAVEYCRRVRARGRTPRQRCRVPAFATASIRVTFATTETTAVAPTGKAVVASASGSARVRARSRTSPSIRAALVRAQLVADPIALGAARRSATSAARAADLPMGPLFALAEEPRQPFTQDILSGTFGPGRFCGTIRRVRSEVDPATGRRRVVRGPRVRRCYVPGVSSIIRVTYLAG